MAKLIQEGLRREDLSYSKVQLWIAERVDVPSHLSVPQGEALGMLITGKTKIIKVATLRILHCAGLFGDRPLEVVEAIACGMPVEEADRLPGKAVGEAFWENLPARIKGAPRDIQVATAIAIIESLDSEGGRAANTSQPRSTKPMFFDSAQDAQKRLTELFQHWHAERSPVEVAQYYAQATGVDLLKVDRIELLLKGETLLNEVEYGILTSNRLDLQQENGELLTPEELRWFCETAWRKPPGVAQPSATNQDTISSHPS
ncbi:MAG: hypothetical protein ACFCA4_12455 [Cyanophyceae cyanobacterium]